MKQSLYELTENYYQALDFLTDPENDIDGQTLADTLESLDGELDDKIINVGKFIVSIENQADGIMEAEKRMKQRRQALEKKAGWLRDYALSAMQRSGHNKITASDIALSLAKLPASVQVQDESQIPDAFWRVKTIREIDKTAIKQAGGCQGAAVASMGFRLSIK